MDVKIHSFICPKYLTSFVQKETATLYQNHRFSLASIRGFEPPTYRLGGGRSILLSYIDKLLQTEAKCTDRVKLYL